MIDPDLREMIEPNLKMVLAREHYIYIDEMFSECYLYREPNGLETVTLKPTTISQDVTVKFLALNGSFAGTGNWELVKTKGKLL